MNLNPTHHATQVADVNHIPVCNFQTKQVKLRMMAKQLGPVNMTKLRLVGDNLTWPDCHEFIPNVICFVLIPKWYETSKLGKN